MVKKDCHMEIQMAPIGIIHTQLQDKDKTPIQSSRSDILGSIEVFPQFEEGLEGIEDFSRIFLLYHFHQSEPCHSLLVQPFLDDQKHGVFSTRYPVRPNPIGMSVVEIISREGHTINFKGADMLDGTPLLDIKPFFPDFDNFNAEKTGWYQKRKYQ
jgi:tRNA (adenine37-N6)-methyltransferase